MKTLWIVCPTYFDVQSLEILMRRVRDVLAPLSAPVPARVRFVVIDDSGGQDAEIDAVRRLDDVSVVDVPFNLGHQRAIVFGLRGLGTECRPDDWVVTMDSDGQDRPEDLPRLLSALATTKPGGHGVVLARRTSRQESLAFGLMYRVFKLAFRALTGTVVRTGNFAAFQGELTRQVLWHPNFDLSYSSALLSLGLPTTFVPCPRGARYAGESRMGTTRLIMHGLRMLMPYVDRIATRALILFGASFAVATGAAAALATVHLATDWRVPAWAASAVLWMLVVSFVALGHFIVLFVTFAATAGPSFRALHFRGPSAHDTASRSAPARAD